MGRNYVMCIPPTLIMGEYTAILPLEEESERIGRLFEGAQQKGVYIPYTEAAFFGSTTPSPPISEVTESMNPQRRRTIPRA